MNIFKKTYLRIKIYRQGKYFMNMLSELGGIIGENGSITAQAEFAGIYVNIKNDYEDRENTPSFFIELIDYMSVYLDNPDRYKGNKTMEIRAGLMKAVFALYLIAADKIDDFVEVSANDDSCD